MLHLRESGAARPRRADRHRRHAGRSARLVGDVAAPRGACGKCCERDGVDPDDVIMSPAQARERGLTSTVCFPARQPGAGRLGHQEHGDRSARRRCRRRLSQDRPGPRLHSRERRHRGDQAGRIPIVRLRRGGPSTSGRGRTDRSSSYEPIKPGDVIVLIGRGPMGSGMEETYQITSALKHLSLGPRGGGDHRRAVLRRQHGSVHRPRRARGAGRRPDRQGARRRPDPNRRRSPSAGRQHRLRRRRGGEVSSEQGAKILAVRPPHPQLSPDPRLPDDTRLWAALVRASGGTWGGCVYDVERIIAALETR